MAAGSRVLLSSPRRTWRASTASSRRSPGRGRSSSPPHRRSSRHRRQERRARRPWSRRAPCGETEPAAAPVAAPGRRALRRGSLRLGRRSAGTLACGRRARGLGWGARVEGSERLAQAVGLAGELVKTLLDLFTQAVNHVSLPRVGVGDRIRRLEYGSARAGPARRGSARHPDC